MVERSVTYLNNIKLDSLKGFGEKRYSSLKKSNLSSIADLLRFFPKKHIDRSKIKKIVEINDSDIDKEAIRELVNRKKIITNLLTITFLSFVVIT